MRYPEACNCGSADWTFTCDFSNGDRYWNCQACGAYVNDKLLPRFGTPQFTGFPRIPSEPEAACRVPPDVVFESEDPRFKDGAMQYCRSRFTLAADPQHDYDRSDPACRIQGGQGMTASNCSKCGSDRLTHVNDILNPSRNFSTCSACGENVAGQPFPMRPVDPATDEVVLVSGWERVEDAKAACDVCVDAGPCKRLNQCLRYKCEFGKVDKP